MSSGYSYETISPLEADYSSPSCSDHLEPYVVFRNQISLSSLPSHAPASASLDYFSLDVEEDKNVSNDVLFHTPSPAEAAPKLKEERTFEGGWFAGTSRFKSPMLQLHKEILDFCNFLSPTSEEQASRCAAIDRIRNVITCVWPNCKVEIFGSFKTGLYLPTSDIDVVILDSYITTPRIGLVALSRLLSQRGIAKNIQVIAKARVPIIKFVEKQSGIAFDISFDAQNGPKAAEFIKDYVLQWPALRPLCLILKVFLQQRELNEVYSGGIGSYALLTMLIALLRNLQICQASPEHNLGVLLVHFFDFYGRKLNTSDVGVSCNGPGIFFSKTVKGFLAKGRQFLIAIQDPQTHENDIGKNSFNYGQIRSAFRMAFSTLTNAKAIMCLGPTKSILGTIIRPDPVLLERKGSEAPTVTQLLFGGGESLLLGSSDPHGLFCNWRFDDDNDGALPRGNGALNKSKEKEKKRRGCEVNGDRGRKKCSKKKYDVSHSKSKSVHVA